VFENDTFLFFDDNLELIEAIPGTISFEFRVLKESLTNEDVRLMLTIELRLTRSTFSIARSVATYSSLLDCAPMEVRCLSDFKCTSCLLNFVYWRRVIPANECRLKLPGLIGVASPFA
jgi:hypothetical protein